MKLIVSATIIAGILSISVFSQSIKPKPTTLPAGIATWSGEYSDKFLNNSIIKARLKKLMGTKSYDEFIESFETLAPIAKDGSVLFASGCLIHACTQLESAIAINFKNNTVHAAIFNTEKPTRYFNERRSKAPQAIIDWATNLDNIKTNK